MFKKLATVAIATTFVLAGCGTSPDVDSTPTETPEEVETTTEDTPNLGLGGDMKFEYTQMGLDGEVSGEWIVSVYDVEEHNVLEDSYPYRDGVEVWPEDYTDAEPADGNKYVTVEYIIENNGDSPAVWEDVELMLSDDHDSYGEESETDGIATALTKGKFDVHERIIDEPVNPGKERASIMVFEVPESFNAVFVLFFNPYGDGMDADGVMIG